MNKGVRLCSKYYCTSKSIGSYNIVTIGVYYIGCNLQQESRMYSDIVMYQSSRAEIFVWKLNGRTLSHQPCWDFANRNAGIGIVFVGTQVLGHMYTSCVWVGIALSPIIGSQLLNQISSLSKIRVRGSPINSRCLFRNLFVDTEVLCTRYNFFGTDLTRW